MSPPPESPKRKAPPLEPSPPKGAADPPVVPVRPPTGGADVEGIDLGDFEDEQPPAGLKLDPQEVRAPTPSPERFEPPLPQPPAKPVAPTAAPPSPANRTAVRPTSVVRAPPPVAPAWAAAPRPDAAAAPPAPAPVVPPVSPASAAPTQPDAAAWVPPPANAHTAPVAPTPVAPPVPAPPPAPATVAPPPPALPPPAYYGAPYPYPPQGYYPPPYPAPYPAPYPPPYGFGAPNYYYPPPVVYTVPMAPPPRVWDTREGLLRLNSAAGAGIFVFVLCATLRLFEASTGVTDAPGSRSSTTIGLQAISTLLSISLAFGVAITLLLGAGSLYRLHRGRAEFGERRQVAYRKAAALLALSVLLPAAATGLGWLYLDGVQKALPGSGTISDFGLARLFDHFRFVVLASALAGLAGAFLLVKGLEGPATSLPRTLPLRSYRAFAVEFVAAAAFNAGMVLVVFFALLNPPALDTPASPPLDLLLLAPGPLVAIHALVRLRSFVGAALAQAELLGRERADLVITPTPAASLPTSS